MRRAKSALVEYVYFPRQRAAGAFPYPGGPF